MTDLSRLRVSLTKHNAHKIARLLKVYPSTQVLSRLHEVHAEEAQAHKNLSVLPGNKLPKVWDDAKNFGDSAIDALVLIGIVFSHHKLIAAMINASDRYRYRGSIRRGLQLNGKAYTNFARVIEQLGYAKQQGEYGITFCLQAMVELKGFGSLVSSLLFHKLKAAGWNGDGTVVSEAIRQNFHLVFGLTSTEFSSWLNSDLRSSHGVSLLLEEDKAFFESASEGLGGSPFRFIPGHVMRSVGPLSKGATAKVEAAQVHNDIQNRLYTYLCKELGAAHVGTELDTGYGTTIDVATQYAGKTTFYEIKTSKSVRTSVRQAIPQLLEYAYWPTEQRAGELVIVSHRPSTELSTRYLEFLRQRFGIPIFYRQFDLEKDALVSN